MRNDVVTWNVTGLTAQVTGVERLAIAYAQAVEARLPRLRQRVLIESDRPWAGEFPEGVEILQVTPSRGGVAYPRVIRDSIAHSWAALTTLGSGADKLSYTIHDWGPFRDPTIPLRARLAWMAAMEHGVRRATKVHITNEHLLTDAPAHLRAQIKRKAIISGYPIGNLFAYHSGPTLGEPIGAVVIGSDVPRKRHRELAALWEATHGAGEGMSLTFVGGGTEKISGYRLCQGLGRTDDSVVADLLGRATVLLSVSTYEGLNMPAHEAISMGVPVVGTPRSVAAVAHGPGVRVISELSAEALIAGVRWALSTGKSSPRESEQPLPLVDLIAEWSRS